MSTVNTRIKLKHDITQNWNSAIDFIPLKGELIIYDDYESEIDSHGNIIRYIPNIKIGDGLAYVPDLPFIDQDLRQKLLGHINNEDIHVSPTDRLFWDNKINIDDSKESYDSEEGASLEDETLVFSRNYFA